MSSNRQRPSSQAPVIVWFRQDLRVLDNPALSAAAATGSPLLPVFILEEEKDWPLGTASSWWLHQSLERLAQTLSRHGLPLVLCRGSAQQELAALAAETSAESIHWNRRYTPDARTLDQKIACKLQAVGLQVTDHPGALLREPGQVQTGQGGPYKVFTPFSKKFVSGIVTDPPLPEPEFQASSLPASSLPVDTMPLDSLGLVPAMKTAEGLAKHWQPGEKGAQQLLKSFLAERMANYETARDIPCQPGTSQLSPHLHWGEISPRQVWHAVCSVGAPAQHPFLRQLLWREFAYHLLHHFPQTTETAFRPEFSHFPWDGDPAFLPAWQHGQTGYPLVDAGMRQLKQSGWMHNRVRMVAASFLVKHLLLPWQDGARWFWNHLVDADLANNSFGWQWTAGCGTDAAPFYRIFNPVAQGKRFDSSGDYIRKWVPELSSLPAKVIHAPWLVADSDLEKWGVKLGQEYPLPVVDHGQARQRALESYQKVKQG